MRQGVSRVAPLRFQVIRDKIMERQCVAPVKPQVKGTSR